MNTISPPLTRKPRTEAEAQYAVDHARHRQHLTAISCFLEDHNASPEWQETLRQVQERICDDMARRIRNQ